MEMNLHTLHFNGYYLLCIKLTVNEQRTPICAFLQYWLNQVSAFSLFDLHWISLCRSIYIHIHGNRINLTQTVGRCPFRSMILWGCRPPSFRTSTTVSRQGRGSAPSNTTRCEVSKDLGTPYTGDLRNPAETNSIFAYPRYSHTDKVAGGKTDRRLLVARQMLRDRKPIFDWREFPLTKCILYIVQRLTVTTTTKGSITGSKIPTRL